MSFSTSPVIVVGEIAISDHRSSQPTINEIRRIAAESRSAGILSGKAGIVNLHLGDGIRMLDMIIEILKNTEIPYTQFLPTHLNRNPYLFKEAVNYARAGGYIDFTTSYNPAFMEKGEIKASLALKICLDSGVPDDRITFSSDGQGSLPVFNEKKQLIKYGVGKVVSNFNELKDAVLKDRIPLDIVLKVLTSNPAELLKLKGKGRIKKGCDADIVLIDEKDFEIDTVLAKGQIMIKDRQFKVIGTFEA
jgi:beta-aspartyl-dipeptidase (metallo-type)